MQAFAFSAEAVAPYADEASESNNASVLFAEGAAASHKEVVTFAGTFATANNGVAFFAGAAATACNEVDVACNDLKRRSWNTSKVFKTNVFLILPFEP